MWRGAIKSFCDPDLLNSLAAVQRYSLLKVFRVKLNHLANYFSSTAKFVQVLFIVISL